MIRRGASTTLRSEGAIVNPDSTAGDYAYFNAYYTLAEKLGHDFNTINNQDEKGRTLLMVAAFQGHHDNVDCLLTQALKSTRSYIGLTAAEYAYKAGHEALAKKLGYDPALSRYKSLASIMTILAVGRVFEVVRQRLR